MQQRNGNDNRQNIVIVGGGGGGALVAHTLSKTLDTSRFNLILIDPRPHLVLRPPTIRVPVVNDDGLQDKVLLPLKDIFFDNKGAFYQAKVVGIIKSDEGPSGDVVLEDGNRIRYDILALAPGSVWYGAFALPSDPAELNKWWAKSRETIQAARDIVLVGAGAVGLELAGEIRSEYPDKIITVVQGSNYVLNKAYPIKFRKALESSLAYHKINVISNDRVGDLNVKGGYITSGNGRTIRADLVLATYGSKPNTEFIGQSLGAEVLSSSGHVRVRPTLQLLEHPNIFALGDILDIPEQKQMLKAKAHAVIVAANILAYVQGGSLKEYRTGPEILFVSFGKIGGVGYIGILWGIVVGGWLVRRVKGTNHFLGRLRAAYGF